MVAVRDPTDIGHSVRVRLSRSGQGEEMPSADPPAVLLDVDGTLIDSNYQHALAWFRALKERGRIFALVDLHRHIGMGGDQLVKAIAGDAFDAEHGDAAAEAEKLRYREITGDMEPLEGAKDLIDELLKRDCDVILASSGSAEDTERAIKLLEVEDLELKHTTSSDVEQTKPEPDLIKAALELVDGDRESVLVGDSTWDCEAAKRAGVRSVGVLTGGFSEDELREAGAMRVYRKLTDLIDDLDDLLGSLSAE
jgi:HAD superfamily hydrolase (TIGR01549 family)